MNNLSPDENDFKQRLEFEHLHAHFTQLPAVIIAPAVGGLFTCWVLWEAVNKNYLIWGMAAVLLISAIRILVYFRYFSHDNNENRFRFWKYFAVTTSFISGCIWGSAAIFIYPPILPEYQVYMLVLLSLVPVAPVAALAVYMPTFYAYYIPCISPFIIQFALQDTRAENMTAILLLMLLGATITFAKKYSNTLSEAIRLRLTLAEKTKALEHASETKNRFLASASHDLRQPVHAMSLLIETLVKQKNELQNNKLFQQINSCIINLRRMLDTMLDISKLDANVIQVNKSSFMLNDIFDRLRNEYASLAIQKNINFRCIASNAIIYTDAVLLERILRNLLSNAIKYTNSGKIILAGRKRGNAIHIKIYDTGVGFNSEQKEKIFHEYVQLQNPERNLAKGLGLGLSIVDRLARLLDHPITVFSKEGKGSVFTISVPESNSDIVTTINNEETPYALPLDLSSQVIFIIDDDSAVRTAMADFIGDWGASVFAVSTAKQAINKIELTNKVPDLLIVDYRLADNNTALDAISLLTHYLNKEIPSIIMTGDTAPERIVEAHQAGHILLHKPVDPNLLKACLGEIVQKAK